MAYFSINQSIKPEYKIHFLCKPINKAGMQHTFPLSINRIKQAYKIPSSATGNKGIIQHQFPLSNQSNKTSIDTITFLPQSTGNKHPLPPSTNQ